MLFQTAKKEVSSTDKPALPGATITNVRQAARGHDVHNSPTVAVNTCIAVIVLTARMQIDL